MSRARYLIGDTLAVLPTLDPASVDLVVTSPPFLALRSYLPADHPDKPLEHGGEPSPAAFLATLLDVTELLGRALAPHGSIAVELGDTYAGSHTAGSPEALTPHGRVPAWKTMKGMGNGGRRNNPLDAAMGLIGTSSGERARDNPGQWPLPKSLSFVPQLYGASLAYGRNLLALPGAPEWREFEPWRVRNLIAWVRPNPPVGALGDKWRPATSYITVATRSATRYWDDIPTRRPHAEHTMKYPREQEDYRNDHYAPDTRGDKGRITAPINPAGAPLLDWWEITPTGFTSRLGAHYATFPSAIVEPLVEAMCPRRVCRTCGAPSRRLVHRQRITPADDSTRRKNQSAANPRSGFATDAPEIGWEYSRETVGWSTCGCPGTEATREDGFHDGPGWRPGLVLDPYCGTGTSLLVATGHGREAIGVDLDERNALLAEERIGMFLTVESAGGPPPALGQEPAGVTDPPEAVDVVEEPLGPLTPGQGAVVTS